MKPKSPRPYKGQTQRHEVDDRSLWHDYSHPEAPAKEMEHMDVLDPERPSGAATASFGVRWFR